MLKRKAALDEQEEELRESAGDALDMFSIEVGRAVGHLPGWMGTKPPCAAQQTNICSCTSSRSSVANPSDAPIRSHRT